MTEKFIALLREKPYQISRSLMRFYKQLKLTEKEFLYLIYLENESEIFNPKKMAEDMDQSLNEVLSMVQELKNKGILQIELKDINQRKEECISLKPLYDKLSFLLLEEKEVESHNLFDIFEKEFGRTLSPIEFEIINSWKQSNMKEELILLALKEAVFNGVSNLRYIDKILYDWQKKGIQSAQDVNQEKQKFKQQKAEQKEIFAYDWLNDKDE